MQEADWQCEICGDADAELNVHHIEYREGRRAWDYPLEELECLCNDCHTIAHLPPTKLRAWINRKRINLEIITQVSHLPERIVKLGIFADDPKDVRGWLEFRESVGEETWNRLQESFRYAAEHRDDPAFIEMLKRHREAKADAARLEAIFKGTQQA